MGSWAGAGRAAGRVGRTAGRVGCARSPQAGVRRERGQAQAGAGA